MPDDVSEAVESAYAKHGGTNPPDGGGGGSADTSGAAGAPSADGSGPESSAPPPSSTDAATRQPGGGSDEPTNADWATPEKRTRILRNARQAERAEFAEAMERQLGFKLDDHNAIANVQAFMANPHAYMRAHAAHYGLTPSQGQAVADAAATKKNGAASTWQKPVPILTSEDGRKAYDADAVDAYIANLQERIDDIEQRFGGSLSEIEQERRNEAIATDARAYATDMMSFAKTWAGFDELKGDILALMQSDRRWTIESAYNRLMQAKYIPSLQDRHRKSFMDELNTRPTAPKVPAPGEKTRRPSGERRGLTVREAIQAAVEKHAT